VVSEKINIPLKTRYLTASLYYIPIGSKP